MLIFFVIWYAKMMICPPPNEPPSEPAPATAPAPIPARSPAPARPPAPAPLSLEPPEAISVQSMTDEIPIAQATLVDSAEASIYETATAVVAGTAV